MSGSQNNDDCDPLFFAFFLNYDVNDIARIPVISTYL